jgi:hypothetical protein
VLQLVLEGGEFTEVQIEAVRNLIRSMKGGA